jgi:hypothetical protein
VREIGVTSTEYEVAKPTKKLEDILVEAGIATTKDLERARRRMSERGGRLLANLACLDSFDDVAFARGLAKAFSLPLADGEALTRVAAPRTPSRRAALRALAIERVLLPIGATRTPRAVEVAMFDPTDADAIDRLRAICGGVKVQVHVAPRRTLLDAIAQTYGREAAGVLSGSPAAGEDGDEDAELIDDYDDDEKTGVEIDVSVTPAPVGANERTPTALLGARFGRPPRELQSRETPTPQPAAQRDNRLVRVLLDAVALLSDLLEDRLQARTAHGRQLALLSRLVARELGCSSALVDEIGMAAHVFGVDRALRDVSRREGRTPPDLCADFGWAGGAPEGVVPILSALAVVADGFPAPWRQARAMGDVDAPLGAQIIAAVSEYLSLAEATRDGQHDHHDKATLHQLLRVTTAPEIIEALERVLDAKKSKETTHVG